MMIEAVKREKGVEGTSDSAAVAYQAIFFCFILVIGNYMLLNLFLAILLKFISENSEVEQQNLKQESDQKAGKSQQSNELSDSKIAKAKED